MTGIGRTRIMAAFLAAALGACVTEPSHPGERVRYLCDSVVVCVSSTVGRGLAYDSLATDEVSAAEEYRGLLLSSSCVERPMADAKCWTEATYPGPFDPVSPGGR